GRITMRARLVGKDSRWLGRRADGGDTIAAAGGRRGRAAEGRAGSYCRAPAAARVGILGDTGLAGRVVVAGADRLRFGCRGWFGNAARRLVDRRSEARRVGVEEQR